MAIIFEREPIEASDIDVWGPKELAQNRRSDGVLTSYLYESAGALYLAKGKIGFSGDSSHGTIENDANYEINTAGLTAYTWAKIEVSISGTMGTITASDISGQTDPDTLPSAFSDAYDGVKGGYYIDTNKRCLGVVFYTGARFLYIVNGLSATDGYIGGIPDGEKFLKWYRHAGIDSNQDNFLKQFRSVIVGNWEHQSSTEDNGWRDVTWSQSLSLFCAVSAAGTNQVATSPDGTTWTSRSAASVSSWYSVTWSETLGLFCAVGASAVMTSPDGETWTTRTPAASNTWADVIYADELGLFISVSSTGTGDRVMTSPDGITWTSRVNPTDDDYRRIAWSPELTLLVAVATSGAGDSLMTSPDGITWTDRTNPMSTGTTPRSIVWSPKLKIFLAANIGTCMTSPDGITWTLTGINFSSSKQHIAWSPELELFCAVGAVTNTIETSIDGTNWVVRSNIVNGWQAVAWSPELGIFVTVSNTGTGNRVGTSFVNQ